MRGSPCLWETRLCGVELRIAVAAGISFWLGLLFVFDFIRECWLSYYAFILSLWVSRAGLHIYKR